jgi:hypothetical protein
VIKFRAKIKGKDEWMEGSSLVETSGGYVIVNGGMEWYDGSEWGCGAKNWDYVEIDTLIIEK